MVWCETARATAGREAARSRRRLRPRGVVRGQPRRGAARLARAGRRACDRCGAERRAGRCRAGAVRTGAGGAALSGAAAGAGVDGAARRGAAALCPAAGQDPGAPDRSRADGRRDHRRGHRGGRAGRRRDAGAQPRRRRRARRRRGEVAGGRGRRGGHPAGPLHGAIGVTREHRLHHPTRRLWSWHDKTGGELHWSRAAAGRPRSVRNGISGRPGRGRAWRRTGRPHSSSPWSWRSGVDAWAPTSRPAAAGRGPW